MNIKHCHDLVVHPDLKQQLVLEFASRDNCTLHFQRCHQYHSELHIRLPFFTQPCAKKYSVFRAKGKYLYVTLLQEEAHSAGIFDNYL